MLTWLLSFQLNAFLRCLLVLWLSVHGMRTKHQWEIQCVWKGPHLHKFLSRVDWGKVYIDELLSPWSFLGAGQCLQSRNYQFPSLGYIPGHWPSGREAMHPTRMGYIAGSSAKCKCGPLAPKAGKMPLKLLNYKAFFSFWNLSSDLSWCFLVAI